MKNKALTSLISLLIVMALTACGGGGGGGQGQANSDPLQNTGGNVNQTDSNTDIDSSSTNTISVQPIEVTTPQHTSDIFKTKASSARFLSQSTFGPSMKDIQTQTGKDVSTWLLNQFDKTPSNYLKYAQNYWADQEALEDDGELAKYEWSGSIAFWENAIMGEDQLRQRMTYALSQILVISTKLGTLEESPHMVTYYQDLLSKHAFCNYRDLLEAVTYSPAMAHYLTYLYNQKSNPLKGTVPDENYAREILQLFTIGLVELNIDGSPKVNESGEPIETYDNKDITGLAKVFTGLGLNQTPFFEEEDVEIETHYRPLQHFDEHHSIQEKSFLGLTIPAQTYGEESIRLALNHIMQHPNVAPFISRQLIQRFVTSNPSPAYIARVATAFNLGAYTLPNGTSVGMGLKGDLKATNASILLDDEARGLDANTASRFGKIREPVLRFTHWARAFCGTTATARYFSEVWDLSSSESLSQQPFRAPSVFNFYRPAYIAPSSESGELGMSVPELQITNSNSIPSYVNTLHEFIYAFHTEEDEIEELGQHLEAYKNSFNPNYQNEKSLAQNTRALVDHLDLLFTHQQMSESSKAQLIDTLDTIFNFELDEEDQSEKVKLCLLMIMSSPEYLIQN